MNATMIILVGLGGALGALCRGVLVDLSRGHVPKGFPYATLAINFTSCFAAGCIFALNPAPQVVALASLGFLGGFSTLSTMNYEAATFFVHHLYARCAVYLFLTYAGSLAACAGGIAFIHLL